MSLYFGIDTSNYTTSFALFDSFTNKIIQSKKLLPVKSGEKGLRQSDAVFAHIKQIPETIEGLFSEIKFSKDDIKAIGVSTKPRWEQGSYMPCFLVGDSVASVCSSVLNVLKCDVSHQQGHIAAALYSSEKIDLINSNFIAFHVSGGTTEILFVKGENYNLKTSIIASSLDAKAGQIVDRVGVMLGLDFPCGRELEQLALLCDNKKIKTKISLKGACFNLSGVYNICEKAFLETGDKSFVAKLCLEHIADSLVGCLYELKQDPGFQDLPVVFAGGVMSNELIKQKLNDNFKNIYFAQPQFSSDNAVGCAILAYYYSEFKQISL